MEIFLADIPIRIGILKVIGYKEMGSHLFFRLLKIVSINVKVKILNYLEK